MAELCPKHCADASSLPLDNYRKGQAMTYSIGDIIRTPLGDPQQRRTKARERTNQPVRRHSHLKGRCERHYSEKITKRLAWEIVHAAEKYDRVNRQPGGKRPLGNNSIKILRLLANLAAFSGRVEPSYEYIREKIGCAHDTVSKSIQALKAHGFLDWIRRYIPTGNDEGPQVQQTSNAYRVMLPAIAARLIKAATGSATVYARQIAQDRAQEIAAYRQSLVVEDQITLDFGANSELGGALTDLWHLIDRRESENRTEL